MRLAVTFAIFALQLGSVPKSDVTSEPDFQPYQRAIIRGTEQAGQACVDLDATVLEHTGTRTGNDLRLYAQTQAGQKEIPFALTESAAAPADTETVAVTGEHVHGADVDFDLHMPDRAYSEVDLQTKRKNFMAVAQVVGAETEGGQGQALGTLTLFDLSREDLPGSTRLPLAETSFPWLHLHVHFMNDRGGVLKQPLSTPVFTGALVPPSRQAQVLYTPVVESQSLSNDGYWTYTRLQVPEHVPLDRLSVEIASSFHADFLREVSIGARPTGSGAPRGTVLGMAEHVPGSIGRVTRGSVAPGVPPIHFEQLHVPVTLASNLRSTAEVMLSVHNVAGGRVLPPLPIQQVVLEMRRRSLCFEALPESTYMLRYGDAELPSPSYPYARSFQPRPGVALAKLGPEEHNPHFRERAIKTGLSARNPELLWIAVITAVALPGVLLIEWLRRRESRR